MWPGLTILPEMEPGASDSIFTTDGENAGDRAFPLFSASRLLSSSFVNRDRSTSKCFNIAATSLSLPSSAFSK